MNHEKENNNAYFIERTKMMIKEIEEEKIKKREEFIKKYKEDRATALANDTALRYEIHKIISASVSEGKSKEEVERNLLSNEKYSKYFSYIPNWVNDRFNKKDSTVNCNFNRFFNG